MSQGATNQPEESFDFKDNADIYNDDYMRNQPIGTLPASAMFNAQEYLNNGNQMTGTTGTNQRISYVNTLSDNYYSRNSMQGAQGATKRQDYKVHFNQRWVAFRSISPLISDTTIIHGL